MKPCEEYQLLLEIWTDGELGDDQARELEQHVAECEGCAAYRAELVRLSDDLGRLTLRQDAPDMAGAIVRRVKRRAWARFVLVAFGILLLKLLDVFGVFGSGAVSSLVVAAGVVLAFGLLRVNPFRLVNPQDMLGLNESAKGVSHARP